MKLLLFVLLGHVYFISLSVTDLIEVIIDDLDDIHIAFETGGGHVNVGVYIVVIETENVLQNLECARKEIEAEDSSAGDTK